MAINIYEKLQNARIEFWSLKVNKSGQNKFAKYKYFELSDILPPINDIFARHKLCSIVSFGIELATMTIYNSEEPSESIIITSPMSSADLKACHAVQNLGAVQTYLRRYLYMVALEIVEADILDATTGKTPPQKTTKSNIRAEKGGIEREIRSKYANSTCGFCGKKHGEVGDLIVLVDGKWGAKSCFLGKNPIKDEINKGIAEQETQPLPETQDIHGQDPEGLPF